HQPGATGGLGAVSFRRAGPCPPPADVGGGWGPAPRQFERRMNTADRRRYGMSAVETAPRKRRWAGRGARWWLRSREARWGVGLTSIWLVGFLVFAAVPLGMSVYISFTNWAPISVPFWA